MQKKVVKEEEENRYETWKTKHKMADANPTISVTLSVNGLDNSTKGRIIR